MRLSSKEQKFLQKKISPTRLSIGSYANLSLVGLIFLFIIRGLCIE